MKAAHDCRFALIPDGLAHAVSLRAMRTMYAAPHYIMCQMPMHDFFLLLVFHFPLHFPMQIEKINPRNLNSLAIYISAQPQRFLGMSGLQTESAIRPARLPTQLRL